MRALNQALPFRRHSGPESALKDGPRCHHLSRRCQASCRASRSFGVAGLESEYCGIGAARTRIVHGFTHDGHREQCLHIRGSRLRSSLYDVSASS